MKHYLWIMTVVAALAIALVGCSKNKGVDTAKLQKSFNSADTQTQSAVTKAIIAVQSEDYPAALTELQKLATLPKLTPEQQKALQDTIEQIKKMVGSQMDKAAGDMQKALPK